MSLHILHPMRDFLQTHLQEPEFLFFGHEWCGFAKDPSQRIKTSKWISTRRTTSKGGTGNRLLIAFLQESRMSTSSISTIKLRFDLLSEQKPQDPRRTRWLQEKGRWAISPNSRASHPLHSYAFGYDSQSKCDIPRDCLWEACHMARVHWEARCEGFRSKEGPHYQLEQSERNQLERDQVQRALEDKQQSTLFTSSEIPLQFQSRAVLHWLSGGLCHTRKCQFKDLDKKKGMICDCPMDVGTRNLCKERRNGERKPVLIQVPGAHKCLTLRKLVMCARNMGAHVQRSIRSTKGIKMGLEIGVLCNQERCGEKSK